MQEETPLVDREGALSRLDGDLDLWMEIRQIWLEDVEQMLSDVGAALVDRDEGRLRRAAHALKGSSGNVGAARVASSALRLEKGAGSEGWDELLKEGERLKEAVGCTREALGGDV